MVLRVPLFLAFALASAWAEGPWTPSVTLRGAEVYGRPAKQQKVSKETIEVVESEGCDASVRTSARLRVSERCRFLRGLYRYLYLPAEGSAPRQVLIEFSVTRNGGAFALLVQEPVEIDESGLAP